MKEEKPVCLLHQCYDENVVGYCRYEEYFEPRCSKHIDYYGDDDVYSVKEYEVAKVMMA